MPVLPAPKNPLTLLKQSKDLISTRTGLNDFSADSKTRALLDTFSAELLEQRQEKIRAYESWDIGRARGAALDVIGDSLGFLRLQQTFAAALSAEQSFGFYVVTGTFGDINGTSSISLPAGEILYSDADENEFGAQVEYELTSAVTLLSGNAIQYVGVRAKTVGIFSNVGKGVIRNHDFTNYVDTANNSLKVINFFPVLNGRDTERDESYRFRLSKYYQSLLQANEASIQLSALRVPGVVDLRVISGFYGVGTVGVVVLGLESQSTTALVSAVQRRLVRLIGPGLYGLATAAVESGFDLTLDVRPAVTLSTTQQRILKTEVRKACVDYFLSVGIGGTVAFATLGDSIRRRTSGVVQFVPGKTEFKRILISKGYSNGIFSEREEIIQSSYALEPDEYASLTTLTLNYV